MDTTTIRLDDDLKARVAAAAERAGKTVDAFMVDAIADSVAWDERDEAEFNQLCDRRWAEFQRTGEAIAWEDAEPWLEALARGENPPRPKVRVFQR